MKPKTKKILIWSGVVLAIILAALGTWYFVFRKKDEDKTDGKDEDNVVPINQGTVPVVSIESQEDHKKEQEANEIADNLSGRTEGVSGVKEQRDNWLKRLKEIGYRYDEATKSAIKSKKS